MSDLGNVVPIRPDRERLAQDVDGAIDLGLEAFAAAVDVLRSVPCAPWHRRDRDRLLDSLLVSYRRLAGLARTGLEVLL